VDNPAVENPSVDNPSVVGQSVSGQSVSEQISNSYLFPTYRGQKILFFVLGIIRDIENLEINEEIGKFGCIKGHWIYEISGILKDIVELREIQYIWSIMVVIEEFERLRGISWIKWNINGYT